MAYDTINRTFTDIPATEMTCWCSISFVLPMTLYDYYKRTNDEKPGSFSLYCPLGHPMIPAGKSTSDRLRDQLAAEKHAREQSEANAKYLSGRVSDLYDEKGRVERKLRGTRAVVTRMKRRAVAGRCPCCSDQFKDLERHMKTKHPNFDPEKGAEALAEKA
jgi:hypothetical protein